MLKYSRGFAGHSNGMLILIWGINVDFVNIENLCDDDKAEPHQDLY